MKFSEEQEQKRIKFMKFREEFHLSRQQLADKLNVSRGMISNIDNKYSAVPDSWHDKIKQVFKWDYIKECPCIEKEFTVNTSNIIPIPYYHVKAACNPHGEALVDYPEKDSLFADKRWLKNIIGINPYNCSIIEAKGDSMDSGLNKPDDIKDGDLLLIDNSAAEFINNKTFVIEITTSNELLIKKVTKNLDEKVILYSNNAIKYSPRTLSESDNALIIGRVVYNFSKGSF